MARAVLEGVAHSFRHCQEVLAAQGNTFEKARATKTGLLKSDLFAQILADDLSVPIEFVDTAGGCYGVALATSVGLDVYKSLEEACNITIRPLNKIKPKSNLTNEYNKYVEFGNVLAPIFAKYATK